MEWVQDTVPFFNCLVDKSSNRGKVAMHSRYYPGEWSNSHCSKFLQNSKSKRNAFDTICKFHSPCFRFFFIEAFGHSLQEWYNARLRYSRSVATSSIVGHILGIGDRHGCNILVHGKTGEVVHIDFGIAYEVSSMLMFNPCSMLVSKFSNGFFFQLPILLDRSKERYVGSYAISRCLSPSENSNLYTDDSDFFVSSNSFSIPQRLSLFD